jgi:hypothetical protein
VLVERFEREPRSILRRTILAALARAMDALVRSGACDPSDALLVLARRMDDATEFETLAEASMDPDLVHVLSRWASFVQAVRSDGPPQQRDSLMPGSSMVAGPGQEQTQKLRAFEELARDLAPEASGRTEALRTVLVRLQAALAALLAAPSLRALAPMGNAEPEVVASLETSLALLSQLTIGARARLDPERTSAAAQPTVGLRPLTVAVSRVLAGADKSLGEHIVAASLDEIVGAVPKAIASLVTSVVWTLVDRPVDRDSTEGTGVRLSESLPNWLPARRTIGGFYVLRPLSSGAVGSVFVVTRIEDRNDQNAERFALKVPEYSETAARTVSEAEFMKMFREEASALIGLPAHANLARFVTFDAGSRPKPILVMELVEGSTLEHMIVSRALDAPRTLRVLDDVLAGLEAMHAVGVAHLDVKPSNVLLRRGEEAVLVDFGLAGRHIRPGCATGPYGAPEVWGTDVGSGSAPSPAKADVYAFGCMAYEALMGKVLFDAGNEMAQIAAHVAHDGFPPGVKALASHAPREPLAQLLFSTLRRNPSDRPTASTLRAELAKLAPRLARLEWPPEA